MDLVPSSFPKSLTSLTPARHDVNSEAKILCPCKFSAFHHYSLASQPPLPQTLPHPEKGFLLIPLSLWAESHKPILSSWDWSGSSCVCEVI